MYNIVKSFPSGFYELSLLAQSHWKNIKKYGSDIFLLPKQLSQYKQLNTFDKAFGKINKKMYEHLYKNADLKHLTPNIPWAASSVLLSLQNVNCWVNLFPTASEMYDQYDY